MFSEITQFDKEKQLKIDAGVDRLNQFSNEYELQTICELFPALTPEVALNSDDTFFTKHLLSNLEKSNFEKKFSELLRKKYSK